jgi:hypothetical protein
MPQPQLVKDHILCCTVMSKSASELSALLKPLLAAGIIVVAFGIICIWIGNSVISIKEEGDGFTIIEIRFLVGGCCFNYSWFHSEISHAY